MSSHIDERSTHDRSDADLYAARAQRLRRRLERLIGIAATEGNKLVPLRNGDQIFAAMLERHPWRGAHRGHDDVRVLARGHRPRVRRGAAERARAGVRVRLLLDGFGRG